MLHLKIYRSHTVVKSGEQQLYGNQCAIFCAVVALAALVICAKTALKTFKPG
jgi:hypothetical protein